MAVTLAKAIEALNSVNLLDNTWAIGHQVLTDGSKIRIAQGRGKLEWDNHYFMTVDQAKRLAKQIIDGIDINKTICFVNEPVLSENGEYQCQ